MTNFLSVFQVDDLWRIIISHYSSCTPKFYAEEKSLSLTKCVNSDYEEMKLCYLMLHPTNHVPPLMILRNEKSFLVSLSLCFILSLVIVHTLLYTHTNIHTHKKTLWFLYTKTSHNEKILKDLFLCFLFNLAELARWSKSNKEKMLKKVNSLDFEGLNSL